MTASGTIRVSTERRAESPSLTALRIAAQLPSPSVGVPLIDILFDHQYPPNIPYLSSEVLVADASYKPVFVGERVRKSVAHDRLLSLVSCRRVGLDRGERRKLCERAHPVHGEHHGRRRRHDVESVCTRRAMLPLCPARAGGQLK